MHADPKKGPREGKGRESRGREGMEVGGGGGGEEEEEEEEEAVETVEVERLRGKTGQESNLSTYIPYHTILYHTRLCYTILYIQNQYHDTVQRKQD